MATGLLGMMGNKGGAAIRFKLLDSSVCFVCSHLAAHRENVAGRNADFHKWVWVLVCERQDMRQPAIPEGGGRERAGRDGPRPGVLGRRAVEE